MHDQLWGPKAIEVEKRGRFQYVVIVRMRSGLDGEYAPAHWFRWTAVRHARRIAAAERRRPQGAVVLSLPLGPTADDGGGPPCA